MNKLLINPETLDDPEVLAECKVGETKQLTVTVTVTRHEPDSFEGDITDIEYSDSDYPETTDTEEAGTTPPAGKDVGIKDTA